MKTVVSYVGFQGREEGLKLMATHSLRFFFQLFSLLRIGVLKNFISLFEEAFSFSYQYIKLFN